VPLTKPYLPIEVDPIASAFSAEVHHLMPPTSDLNLAKKGFEAIAESWFMVGLGPETEFHSKEGIDAEVAANHILAILRSFEPKHEHKIAAVAVLMEEWFERIDHWQNPDGWEALRNRTATPPRRG
jgi:hypothetical protein